MADSFALDGLIVSTQAIVASCLETYKTMSNNHDEARDSREELESLRDLLNSIVETKNYLPSSTENKLNDVQQKAVFDLKGYLNNIRKIVEDLPTVDQFALWKKSKWRDTRSALQGIKEQMLECQRQLDTSLISDIKLYSSSTPPDLKKEVGLMTGTSSIMLDTSQREANEVDERTQNTIRNWVFSKNPRERHDEVRIKRQKDTGTWFLEMEEFKRWVSGGVPWLLCQGNPGVGKTFMMSRVIDYLSDTPAVESKGIAFVYFNYMDKEYQEPGWIFRNILRQLLDSKATIPLISKTLYEKYSGGCQSPPLEELKQAIKECVTSSQCTWLLFDALDECAEEHRAEILSSLWSLNELQATVHVFITSRPSIVDLRQDKDTELIKLCASEQDLDAVIREKVDGTRWRNRLKPEMVDDLVRRVIVRSHGMFFLASCLADHILGADTMEDMETRFTDIPGNVRQHFQIAMKSLREEGDSEDVGHGLDIIMWVSQAMRPLHIDELRMLLAVAAGDEILAESYGPADITAACLGLVTVEEPTQVCRLAHYTFQQFLQENESRLIAKATSHIIKTYFKIMSQRPFIIARSGVRKQLYDYAVHNWSIHLKALADDQDMLSLIIHSFRKEKEALGEAMRIVTRRSKRSCAMSDLAGPLHAAAFWGLTGLAKRLVLEGHDPNPIDSYGRTPLSWAAENGYPEIILVLTDTGQAALNLKCGDYGQSPLSLAAENGHAAVVKALIGAGADVNLISDNGQTPVSWAAENGFTTIVSIFINTEGIDLNLRDNAGRSPLSWAVYKKYESVVKLLVDSGKVDLSADRAVWPERYLNPTIPPAISELIRNAKLRRDRLEDLEACVSSVYADDPKEAPLLDPSLHAQPPTTDRLFASTGLLSLLSLPKSAEEWSVIFGFWIMLFLSLICSYLISIVFSSPEL